MKTQIKNKCSDSFFCSVMSKGFLTCKATIISTRLSALIAPKTSAELLIFSRAGHTSAVCLCSHRLHNCVFLHSEFSNMWRGDKQCCRQGGGCLRGSSVIEPFPTQPKESDCLCHTVTLTHCSQACSESDLQPDPAMAPRAYTVLYCGWSLHIPHLYLPF